MKNPANGFCLTLGKEIIEYKCEIRSPAHEWAVCLVLMLAQTQTPSR